MKLVNYLESQDMLLLNLFSDVIIDFFIWNSRNRLFHRGLAIFFESFVLNLLKHCVVSVERVSGVLGNQASLYLRNPAENFCLSILL